MLNHMRLTLCWLPLSHCVQLPELMANGKKVRQTIVRVCVSWDFHLFYIRLRRIVYALTLAHKRNIQINHRGTHTRAFAENVFLRFLSSLLKLQATMAMPLPAHISIRSSQRKYALNLINKKRENERNCRRRTRKCEHKPTAYPQIRGLR